MRIFEFSRKAKDLQFIAKKAIYIGAFDDAHKYFSALYQQTKNPNIPTEIAKCLFHSKSPTAKKYILRLLGKNRQNKDLMLLWVMIQDRIEIDTKTNHCISQLEKKNLDSYQWAQLEFIKICMEWKKLEKTLMRREWLFRQNRLQSDICKDLYSLQKRLKAISLTLNQSKRNDYIINILREKIHFCHEAIQVEFGKKDMDLDQLSKLDISKNNRLFLYKVALRNMIVKKKWIEIDIFCTKMINTYPWISELYHFRALARFHLEKMSQASYDVLLASRLNRQNFTPVKNLIYLFMSRFTYEEFYALHKFLHAYFNQSNTSLYTFLEKILRHRYIDLLKESPVPERKKIPKIFWKRLIEIVLQSENIPVKKSAIKMLSEFYDNQSVNKYLKDLENQSSKEKKRKILQIYQIFSLRKKNYLKNSIKSILLRYFALREKRYCLKIVKMGPSAIQILFSILLDKKETPLMRFSSADMLLSTNNLKAFFRLKKIARSRNFPENMLASAVLIKAGIFVPFPSKNNSRLFQKESFYRILYTFFHSPRDLKDFSVLLKDKDPLVVITAVFKLRQLSSKTLHFTNPILIKWIQKGSPRIRALASWVFWQLYYTSTEIGGLRRNQFIEKKYKEYYTHYFFVIQKGLRDKSPEGSFQYVGIC